MCLDRGWVLLCLVPKHPRPHINSFVPPRATFDQMPHNIARRRQGISIYFSSGEVGRVLTPTPLRARAGASVGKARSLRSQQQLRLQLPEHLNKLKEILEITAAAA